MPFMIMRSGVHDPVTVQGGNPLVPLASFLNS